MTKLVCFLLLLQATNCLSQSRDSIRIITLKAKVREVDGVVTRSYIHSVSDTGLFVMSINKPVLSNVDPGMLTLIRPERIDIVTVRRKNKISRGIGIGFLAGALIGSAVGAGSYESNKGGFDFGMGANLIAGAVVGGLGGMVVGTAISIPSRKHRITAQRSKYIDMQKAVNKRVYLKRRKE